MVLQRKTVTQFENELSNAVAARDASVDTLIAGIRDIQITPVAEVLKDEHDNSVYLSQLTSMKYAARFNPSDLDDLVFNEGMIRWTGSASLGVVTFSRVQPPTADIIVPASFPLATVQNPTTGAVVVFRTIETKTMYGPLTVTPSAYYNVGTERYEIDVAVSSVDTGVDTAVGAYTITQFRRAFPDFEYVTNKNPTVEGLGLETNVDLVSRYQMQVRGNQETTPAGLALFCLDNFNGIEDVYVVYGNNVNLVRYTEDAGAVDVWMKSTSPLTHTYDTFYPGVRELIPVPRQPVISISAVSSGPTTYVEGTDYELVTGEGIYAYSDRGQDGIRFLVGGTAPALNAALRIVYVYNAMINITTAYYGQAEYLVQGSDVLFRWAQAKYIEIEAELKVSAGNPDTVLSAVRERVISYINSQKLGSDIEEFDLDGEVSKIFGVDNWTYTTLAIKGGSGVSDVEVSPNEYSYIEDADLVVSLVS